MTPPTNLPEFLADWQRREDEARNDPHHAKDHEYREWLVEHAAGIRDVVEALFGAATTVFSSDEMKYRTQADAAIQRLVGGKDAR